MDREGEATHVRLLCEESPDAAVRACLDRLRRRRVELADALGGRSLRVVVTLGHPSLTYHITFTREGHVMTRSGPDFRPHVELHGTPRELVPFLAGERTLMQASLDGLVTLHVPTAEAAAYRHVRALVAEELRLPETVEEVVAAPGA